MALNDILALGYLNPVHAAVAPARVGLLVRRARLDIVPARARLDIVPTSISPADTAPCADARASSCDSFSPASSCRSAPSVGACGDRSGMSPRVLPRLEQQAAPPLPAGLLTLWAMVLFENFEKGPFLT